MEEYNLLLRSASQLQSDTHFVLGKEVDMLREDTVGEEILEVVRANPDCTLEELTQRLDWLSWSQVFLEVDRLSRSGQLILTQTGIGFITTLRVE